jgi:hypothetical protein
MGLADPEAGSFFLTALCAPPRGASPLLTPCSLSVLVRLPSAGLFLVGRRGARPIERQPAVPLLVILLIRRARLSTRAAFRRASPDGRMGRAIVQGRALGAGRTGGACSGWQYPRCPSRIRCSHIVVGSSGDRIATRLAGDSVVQTEFRITVLELANAASLRLA